MQLLTQALDLGMDPPEQSAALRLVEHAVDGGERLDQAGRSLLPGGAQPGGRFGFVHGWADCETGGSDVGGAPL